MPEPTQREPQGEAAASRLVPDGVAQEVFRTVVQASPTPMCLAAMDPPDMPLVFVNAAFCRMTGYTAEEIVGRNHRLLQGLGAGPHAVAQVRDTLAAGRSVTVDLYHDHKDGGGSWNKLALSPVHGARGDLLYALGSRLDGSPRQEAEAVPPDSRRLEMLGSLAGVVGHEFNNLLTVVLANMEPLERGADERTLRRLNRASDAIRRAAKLTHQLLSFARRPVEEEREIDLRDTIRGLDALLGQVSGNRLALHLDLPASPVPVRIDVGEFETALLRLVRQARATEPSLDSIRISLSTVSEHLAELTLDCGQKRIAAACRTEMQALADCCRGTLPAAVSAGGMTEDNAAATLCFPLLKRRPA